MEANGLQASLGNYDVEIADVLAKAAQDKVVQRIWNKEAALWKTDEALDSVDSTSPIQSRFSS